MTHFNSANGRSTVHRRSRMMADVARRLIRSSVSSCRWRVIQRRDRVVQFSPKAQPFDPKTSYGGIFADPAGFNQKVRLLWFGAGTAEVPLNTALRKNVAKLQGAGVKAVLYQAPGSSHEWLTWRQCLNKFAFLLFQA